MAHTKLILIGGTSHVGKSTLGRRLADELGWNYLSTDQLARHPGRPWKVGEHQVPDDVVDHYMRSTISELVDAVLSHYRSNVWPIVDAIIQSRLNNSYDPGLVIEGSAILPDLVSSAEYARVRAVWLTAPDHLISERIKLSSAYESGTEAERKLVDAFRGRTMAIDRILKALVEGSNQKLLDTTSEDAFETLRSLA